jgi:hypothetical protein
MAWTTARGVEFAFFLGPLLIVAAALVLLLGLALTGTRMAPASTDQEVFYSYLLLGVMAAIHGAADIFGFFAMANITVQLARRQRVREKWVMSGTGQAGAKFASLAATPAYGPGPMPGVAPRSAFAPQPGPLPGPGFAQPARIAPSPVGAKPISRLPIPTELPPDDMTPDWSRPVFSTKASTEQPPAWTPPPVPTESDGPAWPRPAQQFAPLASNELPSAWRRAVQHGTPPAAGSFGAWAPPAAGPAPLAPFNQPAWANPPMPPASELPDAELGDRPVIQPSSNSLPRYRQPEPRMPQGPSGDPSGEAEPGEGI